MRRLPVYLLLDVSGSMSGEPIEAVKNGVQMLVAALRQDPQALETAHLSVITFGSQAQQIIPLTDLASFQTPDLQAGGVTAMGEALAMVATKVDTEIVKSTHDAKGDWKPLMFILTDGEPTDDFQRGINEFKKRKFGMVVACGAGAGANENNLKLITENVVKLDTANTDSLKQFFKWVSSSISASSKSVNTGGAELNSISQLPPPPSVVNVVV